MARTRTKTRDAVLLDEVRQSPVDRDLTRSKRRLLVALLLLAIVLVLGQRLLAEASTGAAPDPPRAQEGT
jgi:hypothetical protein